MSKTMDIVKNGGLHFYIDKVEDFAGFSPINVEKDHYFWFLTRASITSDEPQFYKYIEQISNYFLDRVRIPQNIIYQFLVSIHKDLSADLYINDFAVVVEFMAKRDLKKFQIVTKGDIADIRRLKFPSIQIVETDKVIYCFKVGWKFGLFFDLDRPEKLDANKMMLDLGTLYRKLSFQYVYEVLESGTKFEEMLKDGWFPFIEIIGSEYKSISEAYQDKFDFDNRINKVVNSFDSVRIETITNKWWTKQIFNEKKAILQAGTKAFLQDSNDGYINCIKTLLTEAEGIIRIQYHSETGKSKNVTVSDLLNFLIQKGKNKTGSEHSLLLPSHFLQYLKDVIYPDFDIKKD